MFTCRARAATSLVPGDPDKVRDAVLQQAVGGQLGWQKRTLQPYLKEEGDEAQHAALRGEIALAATNRQWDVLEELLGLQWLEDRGEGRAMDQQVRPPALPPCHPLLPSPMKGVGGLGEKSYGRAGVGTGDAELWVCATGARPLGPPRPRRGRPTARTLWRR